jgi:hypothetical protein
MVNCHLLMNPLGSVAFQLNPSCHSMASRAALLVQKEYHYAQNALEWVTL